MTVNNRPHIFQSLDDLAFGAGAFSEKSSTLFTVAGAESTLFASPEPWKASSESRFRELLPVVGWGAGAVVVLEGVVVVAVVDGEEEKRDLILETRPLMVFIGLECMWWVLWRIY
jgi:hypothetical protein